MKKSTLIKAVVATLVLTAGSLAFAISESRPFVSPVFGEHMVLQRDKPNRIWGWTKPGQIVRVQLGPHVAETKAGMDGRWSVRIQPPDPGGPYTLTIDGPKHVEWNDVLVGDVWLCGGQSNMEMDLRGVRNADREIAAADQPMIRLCVVNKTVAYAPVAVPDAAWSVCSPETVGGFSAVGYFFGRRLQQDINIPIGLIQDCVGGTPAESWTSAEALRTMGDFNAQLDELQRLEQQDGPRYGNFIEHWYDEYDVGQRENWNAVELDDDPWKTVSLKNGFDALGASDTPAVVYFRKIIELPDPLPPGRAMIHLGVVERMDTVFINGHWVGASAWVENPRRYTVGADVLKPGKNVISVRAFKTQADGGFRSAPDDLKLVLGDGTRIPLADDWKGRVSVKVGGSVPTPVGFENWPVMPAVLYNGMIAPITPLAITGAIWYQGEANVGRAEQYQELLPTMIADWREQFGQGDFPFYIVSLAAFMQHRDQPGDDGWAELREAQDVVAHTVPNSGLAVAIDVGDANDIHPKDKKEVGERLALLALDKHYGKQVVSSGPRLASVEPVSGGTLRIHFDHVDGGLVVKGDNLEEFSVAGADGKWFWADARIDGDTVVVSSAQVPQPEQVRYAWQANPKAALFNAAGLPAIPFRTDRKSEASAQASEQDGYRLWLRYEPLPTAIAAAWRPQVKAILATGDSATMTAIRNELVAGCSGLLGSGIPVVDEVDRDGVIVVGTPESVPMLASLSDELAGLGPEGYLIRSGRMDGHAVTMIASQSEVGALYGAFRFLRQLQTQDAGPLELAETPQVQLRVLNHWDNLDGSIERGYAGQSLWNWDELPDPVDPRLLDYARANASIGINGSVLNNVNANAQSLTPEFLRKTKAIADGFRPYGIKVYLSARFSAPIELGGLESADPLDPAVQAWWAGKADEVYALIPDFGGFLVKANSEGQPGPITYGRTHADGANMLAKALKPHGGIVMWRAFVYDPEPGSDRIAQAYDAMKPHDGEFAANVLLQVKNGPLDFQPREPFSPLFGAMPETQLMPELQVTQEYLGQSRHLAYLAPMWREFFDADTYAKGKGSTVRKVMDGTLHGGKLTGVAGVANTGSDRNWTGHDLAQANWYAFGRLAWDPDLSPKKIVGEWIRMTLTYHPDAIETIADLMLDSREAVVDYMTPLGLAHIMWEGHHYGPQPWGDNLPRPDWNPVYYHRADQEGIGFDRTETGSGAVQQYQGETRERFASLEKCPEKYLLWFHHVPWDYAMDSGRTLWEELCLHYQRGVEWVGEARRRWDAVAGDVDPHVHARVAAKLAIQERDATRWRDACLLYFQTFSERPFPAGVEQPELTLPQIMADPPQAHE